MLRTIMALYNDFTSAQAMVEELMSNGFDCRTIGLITQDSSYTECSPVNGYDIFIGESSLIDDLLDWGSTSVDGIGSVMATGPLAEALMQENTEEGFIGTLIRFGVDEIIAERYAWGLVRGGALVSVIVDEAEAYLAESIMNAFEPVNVEEPVY